MSVVRRHHAAQASIRLSRLVLVAVLSLASARPGPGRGRSCPWVNRTPVSGMTTLSSKAGPDIVACQPRLVKEAGQAGDAQASEEPGPDGPGSRRSPGPAAPGQSYVVVQLELVGVRTEPDGV